MNFHLELRKSNCRKELKRRTGRSLDILEVRRHELTAACSPKWAPCRIRYYPGVGRIYVTGPAGQHIGWVDTLADALYELANADTSKVLPGNGLLNGKEPIVKSRNGPVGPSAGIGRPALTMAGQ